MTKPPTTDRHWRIRRQAPPAMFVGNLLLAFVWMGLSGRVDLESFIVGFVVGFVALAIVGRTAGSSAYVVRPSRIVRFLGFLVVEVVRANIRVAIDVVSPRSQVRPGIVAIPLDARTDLKIMLLTSLISSTPGSLSIDVSDDRSVMYVHSMFLDDPDAFRRSVKDDLERRLLEVLR